MNDREIHTWEVERFVLGELPRSRMVEINRLAETGWSPCIIRNRSGIPHS